MTSTEQYTAIAGRLRSATETSAELWKQGAAAFTQQAELLSKMPKVDPAAGVQRYFELVQQAVDVNRELAAKWANAVGSMTGLLSQQVATVNQITKNQLNTTADLVVEQAESVEQVAQDQAAQVEAEEKAEARRAKAAERAAAKEAHEKAREPYVGLTKAELSEQLAARELPKTGNLDELIERLVESDEKRAPYADLTKAELVEQLTERELPKSGTVTELVGRLVEADAAE